MHKVLLIYFTVLIILLYYFFKKSIDGFYIRKFNIKTRKDSREYYTVAKRYNYNPNAKLIISMSLFGNLDNSEKRKKYYDHLLEKNPLLDKIEDSNYRIYIDPTISIKNRDRLIDMGYQVFVMNSPSKRLSGSVWRFLAFQDKNPDGIVIISDTDSIVGNDYIYNSLLKNKKLDIEYLLDYIEKNDIKYLIRGSHMVYTPFSANKIILGKTIIQDMEEKINKYSPQNYGEDEVFLKEEIWPLMKREGYTRVESLSEKATTILRLSFPIIFILILLLIAIKLSPKKRV